MNQPPHPTSIQPGADSSDAPPAVVGPLFVEPWPDPVVDQLGHDPRSAYVEQFWLPVLGPSGT